MVISEEVSKAVREKKKKYSNSKKRKINRGIEGVQEELTKCKEGYFLSKEKETEGMCKRFK